MRSPTCSSSARSSRCRSRAGAPPPAARSRTRRNAEGRRRASPRRFPFPRTHRTMARARRRGLFLGPFGGTAARPVR
ncbi:hypothetical protein C6P91_27065 [Burkholderia multivorans]|nr:hypothetical protein C6P91_27065 [Burkholderia multivorans]